jgi:hypothetical protein
MVIDANRPPSILSETNIYYYLQSPPLIRRELDGIVASSRGDEFQNPHYIADPQRRTSSSQGIHRNRGIRGRRNDIAVGFAPRATQEEVMPSQPNSRGGNTNATFTTLPPPSNSNTMVVDSGSASSDLVISILCFLIIAPCCLASIGQLIYTCHKRRRARMEQQLLAVSTNPTSRMLILSEIFKNDCHVSRWWGCGHYFCYLVAVIATLISSFAFEFMDIFSARDERSGLLEEKSCLG